MTSIRHRRAVGGLDDDVQRDDVRLPFRHDDRAVELTRDVSRPRDRRRRRWIPPATRNLSAETIELGFVRSQHHVTLPDQSLILHQDPKAVRVDDQGHVPLVSEGDYPLGDLGHRRIAAEARSHHQRVHPVQPRRHPLHRFKHRLLVVRHRVHRLAVDRDRHLLTSLAQVRMDDELGGVGLDHLPRPLRAEHVSEVGAHPQRGHGREVRGSRVLGASPHDADLASLAFVIPRGIELGHEQAQGLVPGALPPLRRRRRREGGVVLVISVHRSTAGRTSDASGCARDVRCASPGEPVDARR
mmetsp:Transcript_8320/g.32804  ORF Transcript_8320/g.32804 Transcript_8320/m.32804 type:complete len:299 (-) Transcript_8320:62-958(-)